MKDGPSVKECLRFLLELNVFTDEKESGPGYSIGETWALNTLADTDIIRKLTTSVNSRPDFKKKFIAQMAAQRK